MIYNTQSLEIKLYFAIKDTCNLNISHSIKVYRINVVACFVVVRDRFRLMYSRSKLMVLRHPETEGPV